MSKLEKVCPNKQSVKNSGRGLSEKFASSRAPQVKRRKLFAGGLDAFGFDPLDITGCMLWLKADSITGISDGSPLGGGSPWDDSGPEGNDCMTIDVDSRPSYKASVSSLGNKPAVRFDPTGDEEGLHIAGTLDYNFWRDGGIDSDITVFVVAEPLAVTDNYQAILSGYGEDSWNMASGNNLNYYVMGIDADSSLCVLGRNPSTDIARNASTDLANGSGYILSSVFDFSEETMYLFQNGVLNDVETSFERGNSSLSAPYTILGSAMSGGRGSIKNPFDGHIAEVIVYNTKLSEQNLWDVQLYLMEKYRFGTMPMPLYSGITTL